MSRKISYVEIKNRIAIFMTLRRLPCAQFFEEGVPQIVKADIVQLGDCQCLLEGMFHIQVALMRVRGLKDMPRLAAFQGLLKAACTGCGMSPSMRSAAAFERALAHRSWLRYSIWPSR
jgi:hypothetical protein